MTLKLKKKVMTDFTKILNKAKELEAKMKESQEKIKNIKVEGMSGANSVKVTLNGDGEMIQIDYISRNNERRKINSRRFNCSCT